MRPHSAGRQAQGVGDLRNALAARKLDEDRELALAQQFRRTDVAIDLRQSQCLRGLCIDIAIALRYGHHGGNQRLRRTALGQVAQSASAQDSSRMRGVLMRRKCQHARLRVLRQQPAYGLKAAHAGHRQVHHHHVGPHLWIVPTGLFTAVSLGHDLDPGVGQQHAKPHANQRVVIDQHHADHARLSSGLATNGNCTRSSTPRGCTASICSAPPTPSARLASQRSP